MAITPQFWKLVLYLGLLDYFLQSVNFLEFSKHFEKSSKFWCLNRVIMGGWASEAFASLVIVFEMDIYKSRERRREDVSINTGNIEALALLGNMPPKNQRKQRLSYIK
jgi:hypothetical protein